MMTRRTARAHLARFRRRGSLAVRKLKNVHRIQILGGPMHGSFLLLRKGGMAVVDAQGRRTPFEPGLDRYQWQKLPSGEQRFVCLP